MIDNSQKHKYKAYANATQTVARTKQIVMLYDGAVRYLQHARDAMANNRIEERYHLLTKASEIIIGLQACLDFENGGQIARVLYNFYSSIDSQIFQLHRTGSKETCDQIIADLKRMRDVWAEIDASTTGGDTPPPAPPPASSGEPKGPEQTIIISA